MNDAVAELVESTESVTATASENGASSAAAGHAAKATGSSRRFVPGANRSAPKPAAAGGVVTVMENVTAALGAAIGTASVIVPCAMK